MLLVIQGYSYDYVRSLFDPDKFRLFGTFADVDPRVRGGASGLFKYGCPASTLNAAAALLLNCYIFHRSSEGSYSGHTLHYIQNDLEAHVMGHASAPDVLAVLGVGHDAFYEAARASVSLWVEWANADLDDLRLASFGESDLNTRAVATELLSLLGEDTPISEDYIALLALSHQRQSDLAGWILRKRRERQVWEAQFASPSDAPRDQAAALLDVSSFQRERE